MKPDIYYCIAAHNEEKNIASCIDSLAAQATQLRAQTVICTNGCTDKTPDVVNHLECKYPELGITLVHSAKGKAHAQNEIVRNIIYDGAPLLFIDADVTADPQCVTRLHAELQKHSGLQAVGSFPIPRRNPDDSIYKRIISEILNVRGHHPQSEVAVHDVSHYKPFAFSDPQPLVTPEFERQSKIYFHGRCFILRNKNVFALPDNADFADDTYLPNQIHTAFGAGSIRTRFDANVFYDPYTSIRKHFRTYRRIYMDKKNLDSKKPAFHEHRVHEDVELNWDYIDTLGLKDRVLFNLYAAVRAVEESSFRALPILPISKAW